MGYPNQEVGLHNPLDDAIVNMIKEKMKARDRISHAKQDALLSGVPGFVDSGLFRSIVSGTYGMTKGVGAEPLLPEDVRKTGRYEAKKHPIISGAAEFGSWLIPATVGTKVVGGGARALGVGANFLRGMLGRTAVAAAGAGAAEMAKEGVRAAVGESYVPARTQISQPFQDPYTESDFRSWYSELAQQYALPPDPDAQKYDYRALWFDLSRGWTRPDEIPTPGSDKPWPLDYTVEGHPLYEQSAGAMRPAETATEIGKNILKAGGTTAATMAVIGPLHEAAGALGGAAVRRYLPDVLQELAFSKVARKLITEPAQAGMINVGLHAAHGQTEDLLRAYLVGHIGGAVSGIAPFRKDNARDEAISEAMGDAIREGSHNDVLIDPFSKEGRKALKDSVQSRITVGPRRLTPKELGTLYEDAREFHFKAMEGGAAGLRTSIDEWTGKAQAAEAARQEAVRAFEEHEATKPEKGNKASQVKWKRRWVELKKAKEGAEENIKQAHQEVVSATKTLDMMAKESARMVIALKGNRRAVESLHTIVGADSEMIRSAYEGTPYESLTKLVEGARDLAASEVVKPEPVQEPTPEVEAQVAWQAKLDDLGVELGQIQGQKPLAEPDTPHKARGSSLSNAFSFLTNGTGRSRKFSGDQVSAIGEQVSAKLPRRVLSRKIRKRTEWEVQANIAEEGKPAHWRPVARVKNRTLAEALVNADPATMDRFWRVARSIIGKSGRSYRDQAKVEAEIDKHLENRPPDMPEEMAKEAVRIAKAVRARQRGAIDPPSLNEFMGAIREKLTREKALQAVEDRVQAGDISASELASIRAARAVSDKAMADFQAETQSMPEGTRVRRVFAMTAWPASNLAQRQENIGTPTFKFQTYSKIFKPVTDSLDAMNVAYKNMMFSKVRNGIYPRLKKAGLGKLNASDREQLFNVLEGAVATGSKADNIKVVAAEMRKVLDELFVLFNVPRYRKNYITHMRDVGIRIQQEMGDVTGIEFKYEKPRSEIVADFVRDPAEIIGKYVRAGLKKLYLKDPVAAAKTQVRMIRNISDNSGRYWQNFLNMATGSTTEFERRINESVQAMAQMVRNVTGAKWAARMSEDPYAATRVSSALTRLAYLRYLGFKPASALRNLTQTNLALSELGFANGLRALKRITRDGWLQTFSEMKDLGIGLDYLAGMDLPTGAGHVSHAINMASDVSLALFSFADLTNRAVTYRTSMVRFEDGMKKYAKATAAGDRSALEALARKLLLKGRTLSGKTTERQSNAISRMIMGKIKAGDVEGAAHDYAKYFVEKWQFRYGKTGTPQMFQNSLGRIIGQFGTWPIFYAHGMAKTIKPAFEGDIAALKTPISWLVQSNMILMAGAWIAGVDLSSWFGGDLYKKQFTIGDEEFSVVPPTGPLNWGPGPLTNPILDLMDGAIAIASGQDERLRYASQDLARNLAGNNPLLEVAEALGTPEALTRAVDTYLSVGASGNLMDREGKTVTFLEAYDKVLLAMGFKPTKVTKALRDRESADRDQRLQIQQEKRTVRTQIQRDLARQSWVKTAGPAQVAAFIRNNYPTATWLMNPSSIRSIMANIQKTTVERAEETNRRYLRNPRNTQLRGMLR